MKTILLASAVFLAGMLIYFIGFRAKDSGLNTSMQKTDDASINTSPKPSDQPLPHTDTKLVSKDVEPNETVKTSINSVASANEESKLSYNRLYVVLSQELSYQGFSAGVMECLERVIDNNLKREMPLSIEGMAEVCVKESGLEKGDEVKLAAAFRKSISSSQKPIDIKVWYACSSNRTIENVSPCFKSAYKDTVEGFYSKTMNESETLPGSEFQTRWNTEARALIDKILKKCPAADGKSINKVYAHEC